jgi:hypothetical protein
MDRYIVERLRQMKASGIKYVKPKASGRADECEQCKALSGTIFPIDAFPEYPPAGCCCRPSCGCVVVRVMETEAVANEVPVTLSLTEDELVSKAWLGGGARSLGSEQTANPIA